MAHEHGQRLTATGDPAGLAAGAREADAPTVYSELEELRGGDIG
jgi:hypothetical protein